MGVSWRTGVRVAIVVVAAGWFGWNHYARQQPPSPAHRADPVSATPTASASAPKPTAVKPAMPATWKLGSLTLTACELGKPDSGQTAAAWCAPFSVPENRDDPHSRKITLRLAIVRSEAELADKDIVVVLAGGPGEAATEHFEVTSALAQVRKHHDILLLDQRGTGGSHPLNCKSNAADAQKSLMTPDPDQVRTAVTACLAEVSRSADPRYYTTTIATQDLEDVRKALGSPPFDLIGISYGTRMAQQYLMRYPEAVRSVVLDSVVPNQLVLGQEFARDLHDALTRDFAACTATPACRERFGDPMQTLYQLRDALRANPHKVSFRDPTTFAPVERTLGEFSLASVVRMFAYKPQTAALLPLSIDAAAHGDVGALLGQARLLDGDLDGDMNNGMQMSVICSEDADLLKTQPQDEDTILGNNLIRMIKAECKVWPHGSRPVDFHAPLKSDKPVLLLSGQLDPVTPPRYGKQVLAGLGNARQLILKGQGHSVLTTGCVPRLVGDFIDTLKPRELDAECLDRLGPTPAFINFNGATP